MLKSWFNLLTCLILLLVTRTLLGTLFPGGSFVDNPPANAGNLGSIPWVGKILWRRAWQPIPVRLPGEFHEIPGGLQSMGSHRSDMIEASKQQQQPQAVLGTCSYSCRLCFKGGK